ncbi:hypothetical protein BK135_21510 [Paenibacillus peoriae]|nr:hypothetical protein BK135_21510 [Paenibacillus peoriae]
MIFRSLLQWDSSDCIRHLKVRIPLQRRTLTLLQIQPLRSATARRKVTLFPKWCGAWEGQKDLNTQKLKSSKAQKLKSSKALYLKELRI